MKNSLNKLKLLVFALMLISASRVCAQEDDYTQYFLNLSATNSAFTGMDDYFNLNVGVREGWNNYGIKNDNSYFSFFGALNSGNRSGRRNNSLRTSDPSVFETIQDEKKFRRRHGLGGIITNRRVDAYNSFGAFLNYAYHLPVSRKINFSLGTRMGYTNQRLDFTNLVVRDDVNDLFYQSLLMAGQGSQNTMLVDFGAVIYSKRFFLGFSSDNLVAEKMNGEQLFNLNAGLRYKAQVGAIIPFNPLWELSPGLQLFQKDGYEIMWVANARLRYKNLVYLGTSYASDAKASVLLGLSTYKLSINYSYDIYLGGLNDFNVNTHEIVLGLSMFNPYKLRQRFW